MVSLLIKIGPMSSHVLASALVDAFRSGRIVRPTAEELPCDMPAAERLQDAILAEMGPVAAWKLGATVSEVRSKLGLDHAFFGALPPERLCVSPARIPADQLRMFGVETEVSFKLGRNLPVASTPITEDAIESAIASVHASIEIPATRFEQLGGHGGYALVGDNGATGWLVVGDAIKGWREMDLANLAVLLEIDGVEVARGTPAVIDGGPFGSLVEHVHRAHRRGYPLSAGQYIATGSCTGYITAPVGKTVRARFGGSASVTLVFETASVLS